MEKWNKALDIPVEILFKYLCRDYWREQARTAELEKKVEKLQAGTKISVSVQRSNGKDEYREIIFEVTVGTR